MPFWSVIYRVDKRLPAVVAVLNGEVYLFKGKEPSKANLAKKVAQEPSLIVPGHVVAPV